MIGMPRLFVAAPCAFGVVRGNVFAYDMYSSLFKLVIDESHAVEFGEHQVFLLEDEGGHSPVFNLFRVA